MSRRKKKASMSFLTALGLSANNLRTKKGRTILTAFAGSIGIIGIALILSLSTGVNDYIGNLEEETMAEYPIEITSSTLDITSMLSSMTSSISLGGSSSNDSDQEISVTKILTSMFAQIRSNDLESLKDYIDSGTSGLEDYVKAVEYSYDVDPLIYLEEGDRVIQVNPDTAMSMSGSIMAMFSSSSTTFFSMPENENLYIDSYDVLAGRWPENSNECVLVLTSSGSISDYMLYMLGLRDYSELEDMLNQYSSGEDVVTLDDVDGYSYEDVLGITFKVINPADLYIYDQEYGVWVDKSDNEAYVENLVENGENLTIVGVVQPAEDAVSAALTSGINYPMSLVYHMSDLASSSDVVQAQMNDPDTNIFTGEAFGEEADEMDLTNLISVDDSMLSDAFDVSDAFQDFDASSLDLDTSELTLDLSDLDLSGLDMDLDLSDISLDLSDLDMNGMDLTAAMPDLSTLDLTNLDLPDLNSMLAGMSVDTQMLSTLASQILTGYRINLTGELSAYLTSDAAEQIVMNTLKQSDTFDVTVDEAGLRSAIENAIDSVAVSSDSESDTAAVAQAVSDYLAEHSSEEISQTDLEAVIAEAAGSGEANTISTEDITDAVVSAVSDYLTKNAKVVITAADARTLASALASGYVETIRTDFTDYLSSDAVSALLTQSLALMLSDQLQSVLGSYMEAYTEALTGAMTEQISAAMEQSMTQMMAGYTQAIQAQVSAAMESAMAEMSEQISQQVSAAMEQSMTTMMEQITESMADSMEASMSGMMEQMMDQMSESLTEAFQVDQDTLAEAFGFDMDSTSMMDLLTSISGSTGTDYVSNLNALGYVDLDSPSEIDIYPRDFDSKSYVVDILDQYNDRMEQAGEDGKVITYTDMVGTLMSSVTTIVNIVSYVLIAFIAVSLLVSCIMISIITQISTMERTKEIGILRAMGASKRNISAVFNAETFIIGTCSGLIGVIVTRLLIFPINAIIHRLAGSTQVNAVLHPLHALILVLISIVITVLSGLVPALKAAKKDPVTALRTE